MIVTICGESGVSILVRGLDLKWLNINAFHKCKLEGQKGKGIHVGVTGLY